MDRDEAGFPIVAAWLRRRMAAPSNLPRISFFIATLFQPQLFVNRQETASPGYGLRSGGGELVPQEA